MEHLDVYIPGTFLTFSSLHSPLLFILMATILPNMQPRHFSVPSHALYFTDYTNLSLFMRFKFLEHKPSFVLSLSYIYPLRDDELQTKYLNRKIKEKHSTFLINQVTLTPNGSGLLSSSSITGLCLSCFYFTLIIIPLYLYLSLGLISLHLNYNHSLSALLNHAFAPFFQENLYHTSV